MLGYKIRPRDLDALMLEADPDGSGQIEFDEFASVMGRTLAASADDAVKVPVTAVGQVGRLVQGLAAERGGAGALARALGLPHTARQLMDLHSAAGGVPSLPQPAAGWPTQERQHCLCISSSGCWHAQ
jgi:hypothetical protein